VESATFLARLPIGTTHSAAWLLILLLVVGLPAYFFVFGVKKEDMVGNWMLEPSLLRRTALFLAGASATAFVLSIAQALM
jgi:hypothetical protein